MNVVRGTAITLDAGVVDRRRNERRRRWPPLSRRFWVGGRRGHWRRSGDRRRAAVDIGAGLRLAILVVLVGSALDAALTLVLLERGASEANPLMAAALTLGVAPFMAIKLSATMLAVVVLARHHHWKLLYRLPVRWIVAALAAVYVAVIAWELWLLALLPPVAAVPM